MENPDKTEDLEYSGVGFLGNVFQPNPKGIPKEYSERVIPILVKSLKSGREYVSLKEGAQVDVFCVLVSEK